jgi:hypothetical protein
MAKGTEAGDCKPTDSGDLHNAREEVAKVAGVGGSVPKWQRSPSGAKLAP